jgi:hypothetical protein
MAEERTNGHGGESRLDRIERALELIADDHILFREEHKRLLISQVVLTDNIGKLTTRVDKLAESVQELREAQKHTDERMDALISVVDGVVRRPPPQAP